MNTRETHLTITNMNNENMSISGAISHLNLTVFFIHDVINGFLKGRWAIKLKTKREGEWETE